MDLSRLPLTKLISDLTNCSSAFCISFFFIFYLPSYRIVSY